MKFQESVSQILSIESIPESLVSPTPTGVRESKVGKETAGGSKHGSFTHQEFGSKTAAQQKSII